MKFTRRKDFITLSAEERDVPRIAQLHAQGFARGWSEAEVSDLMQRPEVTLHVIRQVGARDAPLAGFNLFRQTKDEAEIISIAVDPAMRGHGLGDQLMRAAISALQGDRVARLLLEVDGKNNAAIALYRKLGFKQIAERPGYYKASTGEGERSSALVMALDLL